jgi:hypothetical protein
MLRNFSIHEVGKKLVHDACQALTAAFGTQYHQATAQILAPLPNV